MQVILKENISGLGSEGQVVKVADGYARNFLIPKNKAIEATKGNIKMIEEQKRQVTAAENRLKKEAEKLSKKLSKFSCTISVQAGESDKLYGSVTSQDIANVLKEQGINVDKKKIMLDEPIKSVGIYTIPIKLHKDIEVKIKVWVVKK